MAKLFVPITIQAVMENQYNEREKRVAKTSPRFEKLADTILGDQMESPPFLTGDPLEAGVHLHFILPDALTQGEEENGLFRYPEIPNRWLVTRIVSDAKNVHFSHRSWVVESDSLGVVANGAAVPYLTDQDCPYRYLGRCYEWGQEPEPCERAEHFTAFGTGDATFAAYYPSCRNSLGFHDSLEDIASGMLTYSVAGWYEDPSRDPLFGLKAEDWYRKMEAYRWRLPNEVHLVPDSDGCIRYGIVCQGMVCRLPWRGPEGDYPSGLPDGKVEVTIGNTSAEALAALLARSSENKEADFEFIINAIQEDLLSELEQIDGLATIQDTLHARSFGAGNRGKQWRLTAKEKLSPPSAQACVLLARLNAAQRQCDEQELRYRSYAQRMYDAWHTYLANYESPYFDARKKPGKEEIAQVFHTANVKLDQVKHDWLAADAAVKASGVALETYFRQKQIGYTAELVSEEPYVHPADPVLLFSGEGLGRGYLYGEDGRFSADDTLQCRISECLADCLTVELAQGTCAIQQEALLAMSDAWGPEVPAWSKDLYCETLLLDITAARTFAAYAFRQKQQSYSDADLDRLAEKINQTQLLPWGQVLHSDLAITPPRGTVYPAKLAVQFWQPSWNTLFLEWKVSYYPTGSAQSGSSPMDGWRFQCGQYTYQGETPTQFMPQMGRTVVTPHSQKVLKASLVREAEHCAEGDLKRKLAQIAKELDRWNLLAQSLGGFHQTLLSQRNALQFPPMLVRGELMDDPIAVEMTRLLREELPDYDAHPPIDTERFYPIRAGFLQMETIQLVNSFGRRQVIAGKVDSLHPAQAMKPPALLAGMAQLAPRISQSGRMRLNWVDCGNGSANPICGFVIPNWMNHGLMLYDAQGRMLGILQLVHRGHATACAWQSAPLASSDRFEEVAFDNEHLKQFAWELLQAPDGAFAGFLEHIDMRQSRTVPSGVEHSEELALLCGRPLALARAELRLELCGLPAYWESQAAFGRYETLAAEQQSFSVLLGDAARCLDGLAGYYAGSHAKSTYQTFYPAAQSEPVRAAGYIDWNTTLSLNHVGGRELSLLLEPSCVLTVMAGIYPNQTIRLPESFYQQAYQTMYTGYAFHPVLTMEQGIQIPFCGTDSGEWSWVSRNPDGSYAEWCGINPEIETVSEVPVCLMDGSLLRKGGV